MSNSTLYGQTISAVDSSASWVNVSRCEFKSSYACYTFAYRYVTKCTPQGDITESENHGFMGPIREDHHVSKSNMANAKKGRENEMKRKLANSRNSVACESGKKKPKSKDLRHKDVTMLIMEQRIGSLKQLQAMAELRRQGGEYDLFTYLTVHPFNKTEEMIAWIWEVAAAPSALNHVALPRITILQNAAKEDCVDGLTILTIYN